MTSNNIDLLLRDTLYYTDKRHINYETNKDTEERIDSIVNHLHKQYNEYLDSTINTSRIFEQMLNEMQTIAGNIKCTLENKVMSASHVFCEIDADRSVGILNILWHSISFTTRNNTRPQALYREDQPPLFTGRIIALNGDFQDASLDIMDQEYPDILRCEIASMYVPHDPSLPAIVKIKHLPEKELYFDQNNAAREFLLKVLEITCGGGIYHEVDPECGE